MSATATTDLLADLRAAGRPRYNVLQSRARSDEEIAAALRGDLVVFVKVDETTSLLPPVDWDQDPFDNHSWRAQLQTLRFLDALFLADAAGHDGALELALAIGLDWIAANPYGAEPAREYAWADKIVGDRAPYLAYLLRAAGARGDLDEAQARALLDSLLDHGRHLAADEHHTEGSNHGLFQDVGLVLLSDYLPFCEEAAAWRPLAIDRFTATVAEHVGADGAHLEHSPGYHHLILSTVQRLQRVAAVHTPALDDIADRMEEAAAWFVMPDGTIPPVGDSETIPAAEPLVTAAREREGLHAFRDAGYVVYRDERTYLLLSAGHHSHVHKHHDDMSLILIRDGVPVLTEAGMFGYGEFRPGRQHARSAHAHNVLIVDGRADLWRRSEPYGSGVRAIGAGEGWTGAWVEHPAAASQGVEHGRVVLLHPDTGIVVLDLLRALDEHGHDYERVFHLGPDVEIEEVGRTTRLQAPGFTGALWMDASATFARGQQQPPRGWVFPGYRDWQPTWAAAAHDFGGDAALASCVSFSPEPLRARVTSRLPRSLVVEIDAGAGPLGLVLRRRGAELQVGGAPSA